MKIDNKKITVQVARVPQPLAASDPLKRKETGTLTMIYVLFIVTLDCTQFKHTMMAFCGKLCRRLNSPGFSLFGGDPGLF